MLPVYSVQHMIMPLFVFRPGRHCQLQASKHLLIRDSQLTLHVLCTSTHCRVQQHCNLARKGKQGKSKSTRPPTVHGTCLELHADGTCVATAAPRKTRLLWSTRTAQSPLLSCDCTTITCEQNLVPRALHAGSTWWYHCPHICGHALLHDAQLPCKMQQHYQWVEPNLARKESKALYAKACLLFDTTHYHRPCTYAELVHLVVVQPLWHGCCRPSAHSTSDPTFPSRCFTQGHPRHMPVAICTHIHIYVLYGHVHTLATSILYSCIHALPDAWSSQASRNQTAVLYCLTGFYM
jgi:hypothetical protein